MLSIILHDVMEGRFCFFLILIFCAKFSIKEFPAAAILKELIGFRACAGE